GPARHPEAPQRRQGRERHRHPAQAQRPDDRAAVPHAGRHVLAPGAGAEPRFPAPDGRRRGARGEPAGKRVEIPAGQRAEVRFDFATLARGRAVVQTITTSGDFADASNVDVPVYEPATTESFATYGTVDDAPRFEQLVVPNDIFRDVGGVGVQLSSTQLQSLTDAYWYLYAYPYE